VFDCGCRCVMICELVIRVQLLNGVVLPQCGY